MNQKQEKEMSSQKTVLYADDGTVTVLPGEGAVVQQIAPGYYIARAVESVTGVSVELMEAPFPGILPRMLSGAKKTCDTILDRWKTLGTQVGVHFSGRPGSGKTHSMRYLMKKVLEDNGTVICVALDGVNAKTFRFVLAAVADLKGPVMLGLDEVDRLLEMTYHESPISSDADLNDNNGFTALLGFLDGMNRHQTLSVMTSNSPLHSVVTRRPGRVRFNIRKGNLTRAEAEEMISWYTEDQNLASRLLSFVMNDVTCDSARGLIEEVLARPDDPVSAVARELGMEIPWWSSPDRIVTRKPQLPRLLMGGKDVTVSPQTEITIQVFNAHDLPTCEELLRRCHTHPHPEQMRLCCISPEGALILQTALKRGLISVSALEEDFTIYNRETKTPGIDSIYLNLTPEACTVRDGIIIASDIQANVTSREGVVRIHGLEMHISTIPDYSA